MILVIGDILLDEFILNFPFRKSPEANVPIIKKEKEIIKLGGAANLANNINSINSNCFLIGRIGEDKNDKQVINLLNKNKIKYKFFKEKSYTVGKKSRFYLSNKQIFRLDEEKINKIKKKTEILIIKYIKKNLNKFSLLIVSDYNKGLVSKKLFKNLTNLFSKNNKQIIINPKKQNLSFYTGGNIIVPNEKEFNYFFKKKLGFESKINHFFKNKKLKHLIITRGKKKLIHINKEKRKFLFNVKSIKTYDVTGASDTFIAILALNISNNVGINNSIKKAILAATSVVQKKFTSVISKNEYKKINKKIK